MIGFIFGTLIFFAIGYLATGLNNIGGLIGAFLGGLLGCYGLRLTRARDLNKNPIKY